MPGRAEGMERHIAVDCAAVDQQAKADMGQHLYHKKLQTLERKGVKRRQGGDGGGAQPSSAEPGAPMMEAAPMAPQLIAQLPAYSGEELIATPGNPAICFLLAQYNLRFENRVVSCGQPRGSACMHRRVCSRAAMMVS